MCHIHKCMGSLFVNAYKSGSIMSDIIDKEKGNILWILRIASHGYPGYNSVVKPLTEGKSGKGDPVVDQKSEGYCPHPH